MSASKFPSLIYGTAWKGDQTASLVDLALERGFRAFDTACQPKHYNESGVGVGLKRAAAMGLSRSQLFIQTKFTPIDGHDHRVPYNPKDRIEVQVLTSIQRSLENLQVDWIDSWLLHGPYGRDTLIDDDWEAWRTMEGVYDQGLAKNIGISNVSPKQLKELIEGARVRPAFVQNRCYAAHGWDLATRRLCREHGIIYQGFSLLTANPQVLAHPEITTLAQDLAASPQQIIFRFCQQIGMLPLTGTTDGAHMTEDLAVDQFQLKEDQVRFIESICERRNS